MVDHAAADALKRTGRPDLPASDHDLPLVSIVMFVRNRVDMVGRAIDSVLGQGYPRLQFVIQDCASTDGTVDVIRSYGARIELVSEPDRGTNDGFWRGLKRVKGDIIGSCLSDEEMAPKSIERAVVELANAPEAGAITGDAFICDLHGNTIGFHTGKEFNLLSYLLGDYCPHFATSFFRRRSLEDIGFFANRWKDGDLDTVEFELWCRLGIAHRVKYVQHLFARWTVHEQQMSQNINRIMGELASRTMIFDRYLFGQGNFFGEDRRLRDYIIKRQHDIVIYHLLAHGQREDAIKLEALLRDALGSGAITKSMTESTVLPPSPNEFTEEEKQYRAQLAHQVAMCYRDRGQVDEALQLWKGAAALNDETIDAMQPQLSLSSPTLDEEELERKQVAWALKRAHPTLLKVEGSVKKVRTNGRLTVGYNSTLWNIQTGQAILLPVVTRHDRKRIRLIGYSHLEQPQEVTSKFDDFYVTGQMGHGDFCKLARSHKLDVLVETNGLSHGNRLPAMAARCAPVQVSYVNHAGTCGVPNVDYLITDSIAAEEVEPGYYTEQLFVLPRCFLTYTYDEMYAPPVASSPFLANGYITFGNFGGPYKLNLECLKLWASVLHQVPGSKLLLQNPGMNNLGNADFVKMRLGWFGIDPERVIILPGADRETILKNYEMMDISLDSWPYCGGNTIAEALWQGVPVITLKGRRFVAAYGASLNAASGLSDLVVRKWDDFAQIARVLANDKDRLVSLRSNLRSMMVKHGLSDPKQLATVLEDAYFDMARRAAS
jgi:predicted O-linked N-acetylglucosamine transferase (SPINDLY family)/glycosyltransferase involved in cell wall biosynthesis